MCSEPYSVPLVTRVLASYRELTGAPLLAPRPDESADGLARRLYAADFVVLAHDTGPDPLFTYANLSAQRLFEREWTNFVGLPSRLSAELPERADRERLLDRVAADGFIDDYAGVRIAKSGRRFRIRGATVWNVTDTSGRRIGQAATFNDWSPVE